MQLTTRSTLNVLLFVVIASLAFGEPAFADNGFPHSGTKVIQTKHSFGQLWERLAAAIDSNKMGLVTRASASVGASRRDISIPGNAVFGVYRNDFAVRMLAASVPAGIEAPLRFYLTEEADGKATLIYRLPTAIFKPYGSDALNKMAGELDVIFAKIAAEAVAN